MPDIQVVCPSCSTSFKLPNSPPGSRTRCPKCRAVVSAPTTAPEAKKAKETGPPATAQSETPLEKPALPAGKARPGKKVLSAPLIGLLVVFLTAAVVTGGVYVLRNGWGGQKGKFIARPGNPTVADGFQTPDAVLDAYAKALRESNITVCKATMTRERLKHDEDYLHTQIKTPDDPQALEKEWRNVMNFYRENEWKEGAYKRFPVELDGPDRATITCVFQNKEMPDGCRKYVFVKEGRSWMQSDWSVFEAKDLDRKKYPYNWEKPNPPDAPVPDKKN